MKVLNLRKESSIERPRPRVWRPLAKIVGVATLAGLFLVGLSSVGGTVSYFSDAEISIGNLFRASVADLQLSSTEDTVGRVVADSADNGESNVGGEQFDLGVKPSDSSSPLLYSAAAELAADNPVGCDSLDLDAQLDSYHYYGLLTGFALPVASTTIGTWQFIVTIPKDNPDLAPATVCRGSIVFRSELAGRADTNPNIFTDQDHYDFQVTNWGEPTVEPLLDHPLTVVATTTATTTPPVISVVDDSSSASSTTATTTPAAGSSDPTPPPEAPPPPEEPIAPTTPAEVIPPPVEVVPTEEIVPPPEVPPVETPPVPAEPAA